MHVVVDEIYVYTCKLEALMYLIRHAVEMKDRKLLKHYMERLDVLSITLKRLLKDYLGED